MSAHEIDRDQVCEYLRHAFNTATEKFPKRTAVREKGVSFEKQSALYQYQVNFTYLIDEIQRGPAYIVPKRISEANELIKEIEDSKVTENTNV